MQEPDPTAVAPPLRAAAPLPGRPSSLWDRLRSPSRLRSVVDHVALALVAFVPMLASQPGTVTDDTKTYLYLDPGRYVRQAASLWDPNVGLGTVTHENVGYLLPMGPYFWVMAELHVPLWIAQRLWMGALLFAAGAGALYLCKTIGLGGPGRYVAAIGYMYTPYVLQYAGRISVILMPWSGLPWMIAFVILAVRRPGWRYPALFALVVALVSGINASSILYVGVAPALFLVYAVLVTKEATWRRVWGVAWKTGLLTALVSLWWAIGLQIEAAYGVNVLKYTETVQATSGASLASEIVRGLGYWYFYGSDRLGPWTQSAVQYTQNVQLIALSFLVPALCFVAAFFSRWRYRSYFILVTVVGMVLAVGANPYGNPTTVGSVLKAFMVDTTAGLAMRSTDRASPLVILGLAMFLGAGVSAVYARARRTGVAVWIFATAAIVAATTPLWTGAIVADGFTQPASPPTYVHQAAAALDATHPGTRVYALPGNDFGAYRWGDTIDTVYPGLMTRPFATREQQIMGSIATADLLQAVDTPLQDGTMNWNAMAPMASLMSAGDVLVQYDQAYERYDTPLPQQVAAQLSTTPPGLSDPVTYGTPVPNVPLVPHFDEATLALPANPGWPAPLVSYTVDDPRQIVRAESTADPVVVSGDASGLVNASSVGLLQGNPTVLYSGTLDTDPTLRNQTLTKPADLVVTDTNRKQAYLWNSLNENTGYTETTSQPADTSNPADFPIELFHGAAPNAQTTASYSGITAVTASSYGSSITYLPEHQPSAALDGNTQTSWLTDSFAHQVGQWWQVGLVAPVTENSLLLVQPQTGNPDRWITSVTLTFDGKDPVTIPLGPASRTPSGQLVTFAPRTFSTLRVTVGSVAVADPSVPVGSQSSVGFAEVGIPGVSVDQSIQMPDDLLRSAGPSSVLDRLSLVMTRLRTSGTPPRSDVEASLARSFWLPTTRTFSMTGSARISPLVPDDEIDRLVGRPGANGSGIVAYSTGRLPGDLNAGAIATLDDNTNTLWEPGFGSTHQAGDWLAYSLPRPISFDHLDLQIVADAEHSVPTQITVSTDSGSATVPLPPLADSQVAGSAVDIPVSFPTLRGQSIRITFDTVRLENTPNYYSRTPIALPLGVAEVGVPGLQAAPVPATIPSSCRDDLVSVDGTPVWVTVSGTTDAALGRQPLTVSLCGPDAGGLTLGPGEHTLRSALGQLSGFDVDQLAFDSAPGGGAMPLASATALAAPTVAPAPQVTVTSQTATSMHLAVRGIDPAAGPFDLVLGESIDRGWTATVAGAGGLGQPVLVDGFANGWRVDPATLAAAVHNGTMDVVLTWQPQREADLALVISGITILACLFIVLVPARWRHRRRRRMHSVRPDAPETHSDDAPVLTVPFRSESPRAPWWVAILAGVVTGAIGTVIAAPAAGATAGAATVLVLLVPRLRVLIGIVAVAAVVVAGTWVAVHQAQVHVLANGGWPVNFQTASRWAWAAVVFLGAEGVVDMVLRRRAARQGGDEPQRGA